MLPVSEFSWSVSGVVNSHSVFNLLLVERLNRAYLIHLAVYPVSVPPRRCTESQNLLDFHVVKKLKTCKVGCDATHCEPPQTH